MTAHVERERGVYISPLSPPSIRERVKPADRPTDPRSTADPWSNRHGDTSMFAEKFRSPESPSTPISTFADRFRSPTGPASAAMVTKALFDVPESPIEATVIAPPPTASESRPTSTRTTSTNISLPEAKSVRFLPPVLVRVSSRICLRAVHSYFLRDSDSVCV